MANIEMRHTMHSKHLSGEVYFSLILEEARTSGLLDDTGIESIQLQCFKLLRDKSEKYNGGESSSIKVETAESIMKSNLYTIGLYLKSLPDFGCAVSELKTALISEMYQKGRKLINAKLDTAKYLYKLVKNNKLVTINYTYNATINEGIESFFKSYYPDYEAHETPASVDYQLFNPVIDLTGVEFMQKYLENLFLENEFCRNFAGEDIHHLLYGYDKGYKDLLINIFEQVLTAAIGCSLANRSAVKLDITEEEVHRLYHMLLKEDEHLLTLKISRAAGKVLEELNVTNLLLREYIDKSLPHITTYIVRSVKTNTLGKTFVSPKNPDLKPKIKFLSGVKMDDADYRKLIDELFICRYSSDKLALIKEKVKSFGDIEDVIFDAQLNGEEIKSVLGILGDAEIAVLVKRHQFQSDIHAVDLSESEQAFRSYLKSYIDQLRTDRQEQIFQMVNQLEDD